MSDGHLLWSAALSLATLVLGWFLRELSQTVRDLQTADSDLTQRVHGIEVLVAGDYVKRSELEKLAEAIFKKLDRIEVKIDGKADK